MSKIMDYALRDIEWYERMKQADQEPDDYEYWCNLIEV